MALQEIVGRKYSKISARFGMRLYKRFLFSDPWKIYFSGISSLKMENEILPLEKTELWLPTSWWHEDYSLLPFSQTNVLVTQYFKPSRKVEAKKKQLISSYAIDRSKTIGVHFRGTDKSQDLVLTPLQTYAEVIGKLVRENPTYEVLIQTDDLDAQEFLVARFKDKSIVIDELKTNNGAIGMHFVSSKSPKRPTINYFASILILSECKYLVTHTGNGALWEVLYRGNSKNVVQL
jgi:hypothetical protein